MAAEKQSGSKMNYREGEVWKEHIGEKRLILFLHTTEDGVHFFLDSLGKFYDWKDDTSFLETTDDYILL